MITTIIQWLQSLVDFGSHYPDLVSLLLGTAAGYAAGLLVEAYYMPVAWSTRTQQGATVLVTVLASFLMAFLIWGAWDPLDTIQMRASVSFASSLLAPFAYPFFARIATAHFPKIGSIWVREEDRNRWRGDEAGAHSNHDPPNEHDQTG